MTKIYSITWIDPECLHLIINSKGNLYCVFSDLFLSENGSSVVLGMERQLWE